MGRENKPGTGYPSLKPDTIVISSRALRQSGQRRVLYIRIVASMSMYSLSRGTLLQITSQELQINTLAFAEFSPL